MSWSGPPGKMGPPTPEPGFAVICNETVLREGGWRLWHDPNDPGGRTFAGLSERWTNPHGKDPETAARIRAASSRCGPLWSAIDDALRSHTLTLTDNREPWDGTTPPDEVKTEAEAVFLNMYWKNRRWNLGLLPDEYRVREVLFDAAVHLGIYRRKGPDGNPTGPAAWAQQVAGVDVDGFIGTNSQAAIAGMNPDVFANGLTTKRLQFYLTSDPHYAEGFKNRARAVLAESRDHDNWRERE